MMKTRAIITATVLMQLFGSKSYAQLYVGPGSTYFVKAGTPITFDSLTLTPSADLSLTNVTFSKSYTPIPGVTVGSSLARVYTIDAPINFSGTVGMYYDNAELNGNTPAMLEIAYNNGSAWTTTSGSSVNMTTHYITQNIGSSTNLSKVTSVNNGVVLPLQLIDFTVSAEGRRARIGWTVVRESDIAAYDVLHSTDGKEYTLLTTVKANGLQEEQHYIVYDEQPAEGMNYYRLIEKDISGHLSYIGTRPVRFGKAGNPLQLSVFPNPVTDIATVNFSSMPERGVLQLKDVNGKLIAVYECSSTTMSVPMQQLASGLYFLLYKDEHQSETIKLEKL